MHGFGGGEDRLRFAVLDEEDEGVVVGYVGFCEVCAGGTGVGGEAGVDD